MIGADSKPQMRWKTCNCPTDDLVQHLKDAGRLDYIETSKSYRYVDSQQTSLIVGSLYVQAGRARTTKEKAEETLKTSLLDRWENEPHSRDPREFENLWGVVVSLCTMNARRVRLVEILGEDGVTALLRHFPWSDYWIREQYYRAIHSTDPRALGDLWDSDPPWHEDLGNAILSCLRMLFLTGFNNNKEEFYILWLPPRCRRSRRITLKSTDQTWVKFLKDTTYSLTVAIAVDDCLISRGRKRKCKLSRPSWFQSPSLLETAICINQAVEPAAKLIKVPSYHQETQRLNATDLTEWRSTWDISGLDKGEPLWVGSQTRVRVADAPTKWHLLLRVDNLVKRLLIQELLSLKASERTGHWEYTDAEAEATDVRPIPVYVCS